MVVSRFPIIVWEERKRCAGPKTLKVFFVIDFIPGGFQIHVLKKTVLNVRENRIVAIMARARTVEQNYASVPIQILRIRHDGTLNWYSTVTKSHFRTIWYLRNITILSAVANFVGYTLYRISLAPILGVPRVHQSIGFHCHCLHL